MNELFQASAPGPMHALRREMRMRLQRLFEMDVPELTVRARQEASKWLDRLRTATRGSGGRCGPFEGSAVFSMPRKARGPGRRASEDRHACIPRADLTGPDPSRFFDCVAGGEIPALFSSLFPDAGRGISIAAEKILRKRFDFLGYRDLWFGDPIDWRLDPIAGKRAPFVHWSKVDPLDSSVLGDSKVIWELNRHQWLIPLGQAYALTGDEVYARTVADYIERWMDENPPGMGINWASSLEAALRLISWSWALFLFRGSKTISPEVFVRLLEGIRVHAIRVEKYLSYYFAPNTHLTGEALGLFYAGTLFPGFRQAARWRDLGMQILVQESERQILEDGVSFEQSTCYQRYTAEIYLHFLVLSKRNGLRVPVDLPRKLEKVFDFLLAVRRPDGAVPQIGDADGGWLLPLASRTPEDLRGLFSLAAAFFGRSDYASASGGPQPELFWLLGRSGLDAFESLPPPRCAKRGSKIFSNGGYAIFQGRSNERHQMIFDFGPLGSPQNAGHGHADLLSIQCSVFGEPYIVDPGTYCYTSEPEWRDFFRSTAAHSCVVVDGLGQAAPADPFHWRSQPGGRLLQWLSTDAYDLADAEHEAYSGLPDPVRHRRRVIFVKPEAWILVDDLHGEAEHRIDLQFQFAPIPVEIETDEWARARGVKGNGLLLRAFSRKALKTEVLCGSLSPIRGWFSSDYGRREPAPLLRYSAYSRLPLTIVTVFLPVQDPSAPVPELFVSGDDGSFPREVAFGGGKRVLFLDERIVIEQ